MLGVAVVLALTLYGDASAMASTLGTFRWWLLPLILGLTLVNYGLRFVKWHFYLGQIGASARRGDSLAIFTAGLSMAMTPGKVGEVLKPFLLKLRTGTPMARSVPVVIAERLTDGIAMVVLAFVGLLLSHQAWQVFIAALVLAGLAVGLLGTRSGSAVLHKLSVRVPFIAARTAQVEAFTSSSRVLFTPRNLTLAIALGVVSWSGEAVAFYFVLVGLGIHGSALLAVQATFILCTSTLVGSLSLLPGGLGAVDASVTGLVLLVIHASRAKAAAATLIIRFCTLWFGVAVGLFALFLFRGRFAIGTAPSRAEELEAVSPVGSEKS